MAEEKAITSMMEEKRVFKPPEELSKGAYIKSLDEYREVYQRSVDDLEGFWGEVRVSELCRRSGYHSGTWCPRSSSWSAPASRRR